MESPQPEAKNQQSNNHSFAEDDGYKNGDIIRWFERVSEAAGPVQTRTLRRILGLNWGAEYLKKWLGDIEIQDLDDSELESLYTSSVPLATQADFEPFIQRIADGDTSPLLTQQPITAFSRTSGTTEGRYKYVPYTTHSARSISQVSMLTEECKLRAYPTKGEGKILAFFHSYKQYKTKGGLTVGSATSHYFNSEGYKARQENKKLFVCSPLEVIFGEDYKQSTYCHLLLGLFFSDQVQTISSFFAYAIVQAFSDFEELWKELCGDIREGTLSPRISCPKLRKAALNIISPNQNLALKIEATCNELEGLGWYGLIPMLWPNAKDVHCVITGSMQPYVKKLKHYARDLPLVSRSYVSSESGIGANIDPSSSPENVTYALVPTTSYFEFIPQNQDSDSSGDDYGEHDPIPLSQVKIGQEYEIVLTNFSGFYRYRLGDIVEVVGFHKRTPKLKFVRRGKMVLSISVEKTSERDLETVIEKASEVLGQVNAEIVDYTSHADVADQPGHYVIYLEIRGEVEDRILGECCTEMDASFLQMAYVTSRRFKSIGPLELCILEKGTFKKVMDYFARNGGTLSQFKTPRSTNNQGFLEILNSCTIKRFRSTAYD